MGIAFFLETDISLFSSEHTSDQEELEDIATINSTRDQFSQNKLFGKKGLLGRPPMDDAMTGAAVLGNAEELVGATGSKENMQGMAKRIISQAKAKIEKLVSLKRKTTYTRHF